MKTLHVAYSFPPDASGGTEHYVEALARGLEQSGVAAVVAAPAPVDAAYRHDGLLVRRFASRQAGLSVGDLYGRGDSVAARSFDAILAEEKPDLVHQHALTAACSVQLVECAKKRGIPVVFTYHTPTVTCQRGSLLEGGSSVCDGRLDTARCTACSLQQHGIGPRTSRVLAKTPGVVGEMVERAGLAGGAWTAFRMRTLTRSRIEALATLFQSVDRFVALAPWVRAVLSMNGVSADRIVDCAHGLSLDDQIDPIANAAPRGRVRLAHLGRVDPLKGTAILIDALAGMPDAPIDLDIFGIVQDEAAAALQADLQARSGHDHRIRFLPALPHHTVVAALASYDMVAVPSQWMETGPLVVLEAFAAGVPVLGSRLGGIADKVRDDIDGLLVSPHDSVTAWRAALDRVVREPGLPRRLSKGIRPVRTSADVTREMLALYRSLLPATDSPAARPWRGVIAASRP